jgi:hypothetical protein
MFYLPQRKILFQTRPLSDSSPILGPLKQGLLVKEVLLFETQNFGVSLLLVWSM